jgi:hypothetical protein
MCYADSEYPIFEEGDKVWIGMGADELYTLKANEYMVVQEFEPDFYWPIGESCDSFKKAEAKRDEWIMFQNMED